MKRFSIFTLAIFGFIGCSGGDPPKQKPRVFGLPCSLDDDCESKMCIDGHCSKVCTKQADCPPAAGKYFFCGTAKEDGTVACYPKQYDDRPFATGYDCSADGKCGIGWECLGVPGEPDRFCSPVCKNDKECPPKMRCAQIQAGDKAAEMRCVRRQWGHPCVIDDQCGGAEDLCITDSNGAKYCSKACQKDKGGTCPVFAKCEDAGNNTLQCRHKKGYAYKAEGDQCDPCTWHYQYQSGKDVVQVSDSGGCKSGGLCIRLSPYTNETACALPCAEECSGDSDCSGNNTCRTLTAGGGSQIKLCTCSEDSDCASRNCITLSGGDKICERCGKNQGCLTSTSVCVPLTRVGDQTTIGSCTNPN